MDNHAATQHEFTRKALRYFYEDIPEGEYDGSEDDLQEYASTINEGFGYDLDKQIAALQAERDNWQLEYDKLRTTCDEIADERLEQARVSNALQAENERLRDQLQAMLNVFGHPDLPAGSIARYACDEAQKALGEGR